MRGHRKNDEGQGDKDMQVVQHARLGGGEGMRVEGMAGARCKWSSTGGPARCGWAT